MRNQQRNPPDRRARSFLAAGACVALVGWLASPTLADVVYLFASPDGGEEVPPNASPATGTGNYKVDTVANTLDFHIAFSGLLGAETAAHFHAAPAGQNGGIVFGLPAGSPQVGTWNFMDANEPAILGAGLYTNIHSTSFPGGEIRGQMHVVAESVCWGDGSGTACPCANPGAAGEGCANSLGSGAVLEPSGSNSVLADDMSFSASQLRPGQPVLLFVGNNLIAGGAGATFGGGLRCAGGGVVRLGVRTPDANGDASWAAGLGGLGGWTAGDFRVFQAWYRDPGGSCGTNFNLSNAIAVDFVASIP